MLFISVLQFTIDSAKTFTGLDEWEAVKYGRLIPHNLATYPFELKLDISNNTIDKVVCIAFVPDNYDINYVSYAICISRGTTKAIRSNVCGHSQEITLKNEQLEDGLSLWNITKTSDKLLFDFGVLGRIEHAVDGINCRFDSTWVLFWSFPYEDGLKEDRFFYKSATPGMDTRHSKLIKT